MRWHWRVIALLMAGSTALSGCGSDPSSPHPSKEVTVTNPREGISLAGTLTWPSRGCPCATALLLQGAGSHDRDYTLFGHKLFAFLAEELARHGVASLRFDERGVGASGGEPGAATPTQMAGDVSAWLGALRAEQAVDPERIGIVGHSEGGIVGTLVAESSEDLAFLILLGAPGLPGVEYNLQYEASMAQAMGQPEERIRAQQAFQRDVLDVLVNEPDSAAAERTLRSLYAELSPPVPEEELHRGLARLLSPHFRFNVNYDPSTHLRHVRAPVLAVFGEKDLHVPPAGNREAMLGALATESGRNRVVVLPSLNHFMQTAETGSPQEYADIEETLAPSVVELILEWIGSHG